MKANLFKNFKTLKEKEKEKEAQSFDTQKQDNVSEKINKTSDNLLSDNTLNNKKDSDNRVSKKESKEKNTESQKEVTVKKVIKKRPVKKEILEARQALSSTEKTVQYAKKDLSNDKKKTFTIFLKASSLDFLKDLVFYKVTVERQIFYNQSEAIAESLALMMSDYKNLLDRPDYIKEQEKNKKGGRKRNSDDVYDTSTTVYISELYFDFVKNVTYNKVISGDMYYKDWDLLEAAILKLKKTYGDNIQPRPDYIREDEKLRGRK